AILIRVKRERCGLQFVLIAPQDDQYLATVANYVFVTSQHSAWRIAAHLKFWLLEARAIVKRLRDRLICIPAGVSLDGKYVVLNDEVLKPEESKPSRIDFAIDDPISKADIVRR